MFAENTYPNVVVIIPALNEEASLPQVMRDLPTVSRVIVVDNGSTDQTGQLAIENGGHLIREPKRGYGAACLAGLSELVRLVEADQQTCDIVAFVDADYSDHVHLLPELTGPIDSGKFDFVLGSRMLGVRERGAMPPQAVWGNRLACFLMRLFYNARYTDLGPMRAIGYPQLLRLGMVDQNFGWTIEMQIKAKQQELKTCEIPVPYRRRVGVSKISGTVMGTIRAGVKILYSIWQYR